MSILSPKKLLIRLSVAASILCAGLLQVSCLEQIAPGNRYTFTGKTVAQFLEEYENPTKAGESPFSTFILVLKKANLWDRMKTYGEFTCFAPTNDAFEIFFEEQTASRRGIKYNLDSLLNDFERCDTIARSHIVDSPIYTTDLNSALVPYPNLLDRQMKVAYTDSIDGKEVPPAYWIQDKVRIIEYDDSVQNGVVHIVSGIIPPSNKLIGDVIRLDPEAKLFAKALELTTFDYQELNRYEDLTYKLVLTPDVKYDSKGKPYITYDTGAEKGEKGYYYEKRYFKYTGLIEPDRVFKNAWDIDIVDENGVVTEAAIQKLKDVAKEAYGSNADDNNFRSPNNYLYKFVAYHFLPEAMGYNDFNVAVVTTDDVNSKILNDNYNLTTNSGEKIGIEDFFEAMLPHSIMRISTSKTKLFVNRKGYEGEGSGLISPGIELLDNTLHNTATNGVYHFINDILLYNYETRNVALNTRIRIDCTTMSPDFINSGGRGGEINDVNGGSVIMVKGYTQNVGFNDITRVLVRHRKEYFGCYEGDEVTLKGIYDVWFKIPPVPFDGTYEVRLGYCAMPSRGVVQLYFGQMDDEEQNPNEHLTPRSIPLDLRKNGDDSKVGWFADADVIDIAVEDKSIRNRGYMKAMDSYRNFRNSKDLLRRIMVTEDLRADRNYFLRVRQILDDSNAEFQFDYIEIVPKSVYAGNEPEDRH